MKLNAICSVLVSSCDKYEDVWVPFFHFFKKNWPSCPYCIYLSTESKVYKDNDLNVIMMHCKIPGATWSQRLKYALRRLHTEYVLFLLDDFFLLDKVNQFELERCLSIMNQDKSLSVIDFEYCPSIPSKQSSYDGYVERESSAMYFLNCQAAIWRRKDLIRFLNPHENPWQFELFGSERAKLYNRKFLLRNANAPSVFSYNVNWEKGYGLHGGKWLKSNVALFKAEGISVEFSKMGFCESSNVSSICESPKKNIKWKIMYLLYGGFKKPRVEIIDQLKCMILHPREFAFGIKTKVKFLMEK